MIIFVLSKLNKGGIDTRNKKETETLRLELKTIKDQERMLIGCLLEGYNINKIALGGLASHSLLDVCEGADAESVPNFAIALKGRHRTYTEAFRVRYQGNRKVGIIQDVYIVDNWREMTGEKIIAWIRERNGIVIPSRSLGVYLRDKETGTYDSIVGMNVPFFGNIKLLRVEERALPYKLDKNQDFLAGKANLPIPETFTTPEEIKKPAFVKASQFSHKRDFERNFVVVSSTEEYYAKLEQVLSNTPEADRSSAEAAFRSSPIQEYIQGDLLINLNFFYSRVWNDLEFLGSDTRKQFGNGEEAIHIPISLRESLVEQAINMAYDLLEIVARYYHPGIIGPFAIQCMGDAKERLRPIDLCFRIPGSPDTGATPYTLYLHGKRVDFGRRIAMELKDAVEQGTLDKILS